MAIASEIKFAFSLVASADNVVPIKLRFS